MKNKLNEERVKGRKLRSAIEEIRKKYERAVQTCVTVVERRWRGKSGFSYI